MPQAKTVEQFIARVEQNAHVEAIAEFYAENATMRENLAPPRVGRESLLAHERKVLSRARSVRSRCVRPYFVSGDHAVVRWQFEFDWLDGRRSALDELAYQRWEGERIAEETFFYDPAQFAPREP